MTIRSDKKHIPYEEWAKIGANLKRINKYIGSLHCNENLQKHMTKEQMRGFSKINSGLIAIKSELEEAMYRDIRFNYTDPSDLVNVFYGESVEPYPEPKKDS